MRERCFGDYRRPRNNALGRTYTYLVAGLDDQAGARRFRAHKLLIAMFISSRLQCRSLCDNFNLSSQAMWLLGIIIIMVRNCSFSVGREESDVLWSLHAHQVRVKEPDVERDCR